MVASMIVLALLAAAVVVFLKSDRCLDHGGSYDYFKLQCERD